MVLSGVLSGVWFLFRFPSLEAWFSFGLFRVFTPPHLSRVLSREKANFGPRKTEPETEPERRKAGLSCVLSCVLEGPPSSPWSGYLPEGRRPPFCGGPSRGAGANEGEESPTRFLFYIGENVGGALGWLLVHLLGLRGGLSLPSLLLGFLLGSPLPVCLYGTSNALPPPRVHRSKRKAK